MANCQNNMRYARRSMQSMQPDQSVQSKQSAQNSQGCRRQMNGCPDTHDHFPPPICRSAWLMFPGRNGRISTNTAKDWSAELFLKNWINHSSAKEVYADEQPNEYE